MTMPDRWRQAFLIHSQTPEYRRAIDDAQREIERALRQSHRPYLAWSAGKDSGAMLALVLAQRPDIPVVHSDYGRTLVPEPVYADILTMADRFGVRDLRIHPHDSRPRASLHRLKAAGHDLVFVGIRAEEAIHRRERIKDRRWFGPIPESWPIAQWTWRDVWAYHVANNLPYLSLYDERAALVGYDKARFKSLFDPSFDHFGANTIDGVLHWRLRGRG